MVAHITVAGLPAATAEKLAFAHVVALVRVSDAATRGVLAHAAVENGWTSRQLKDAAAAVGAGEWIDGNPHTPGLPPPRQVHGACPASCGIGAADGVAADPTGKTADA